MNRLQIATLVADRRADLSKVDSSAGDGSARIETGFENLGVDLIRLSAPVPGNVARATRLLGRLTGRSLERSQTLALIRRRTADFDRAQGRVVFALGSSIVEPPRNGLVATRNDATVKLLVELGALGYGELSERVAKAAIERDRRWALRSVVNVAHSNWQADSLVNDYGVDPDRILVTGQPVEPITPGSTNGQRDWSTPRFLFAALNWKRKNGDRVLEGFRAVRAAHPNAELHLMGGLPRVDEPGVVNHGFLSAQDSEQAARRERLFLTCTCVVVPSLIECAGHIHAEALSVGMPAIGTTVGGNREVIGDAGLVVVPTDQRQITDAMLTMCDPERARSTGALGPAQTANKTYQHAASAIHQGLVDRLPQSVGGRLPD